MAEAKLGAFRRARPCNTYYDPRRIKYYGVDTLLADEAEMFFSQDFAAHDMAQNKETTTRNFTYNSYYVRA